MPRTTVGPGPRPLPALLVGAVLLVAAIAGVILPPSNARAADAAVQIQDMAFGPATLTVSVGDTVTWTNGDSRPHTATAEGGAFDSGNLDTGQSFTFTFTAPGTYTYRCDYHSEMVGTIVVEAATAQPAAPAQAVGGATTAPPPGGTTAPAPAAPAAGADGTGHQPNTALPATDGDRWPLAQLLMGLGVVALAFGVVPSLSFRRRSRVRPAAAELPASGAWRR